jgi:hypothetical protein
MGAFGMTIHKAIPGGHPHVWVSRGGSDGLGVVRPSSWEFLGAWDGVRALKQSTLVA